VQAQCCDCTLGYAEEMFNKVMQRSTKAELIERIITGGEVCRIKIHI